MKDLLYKPILYYIAVPVVLGLWPLLMWLVYLPNAEKNWEKDKEIYVDSRTYIKEILSLDPERLSYGDKKQAEGFDFTVAIDAAARNLAIPARNYTISSKPIRRSREGETQECQITINEVDITTLAKFLSNLQLTWANLQCQKVTLTKKQGLPDAWKSDLTLKYYY
jgi:hypothetical protein